MEELPFRKNCSKVLDMVSDLKVGKVEAIHRMAEEVGIYEMKKVSKFLGALDICHLVFHENGSIEVRAKYMLRLYKEIDYKAMKKDIEFGKFDDLARI